MDSRTLDDVLPAAQAGEAWALRRVYDELSPRVLGYLRARGAAEPEDLTSEVFLAVLPRLVDDLRARSRKAPPAEYVPADDPRTSASAEEEGLAGLQTRRVRELLATLVPDQRDVLVMRILGDLTVEQVAQALGKSEGAVKQLQRRGLLALRKRLESEQDSATTDPRGVTL